MGRRDTIHFVVKTALEKDGWVITKDPLSIAVDGGGRRVEIDLEAEKIIIAEKAHEKIAVEIKSFLSGALLHEFNAALGQYISYRDILTDNNYQQVLFLAVGEETNEDMLLSPFIQKQIQRYNIKIIVVDLELQTIISWIK